MTDIPACPQCAGENTYPDGGNFICADCAFEWPIAADAQAGEPGLRVRDSNGNELADGDNVVVIKDLKVKGSSIPLKRSEEHTSELQSLMRISYAVFCLKKKKAQK